MGADRSPSTSFKRSSTNSSLGLKASSCSEIPMAVAGNPVFSHSMGSLMSTIVISPLLAFLSASSALIFNGCAHAENVASPMRTHNKRSKGFSQRFDDHMGRTSTLGHSIDHGVQKKSSLRDGRHDGSAAFVTHLWRFWHQSMLSGRGLQCPYPVPVSNLAEFMAQSPNLVVSKSEAVSASTLNPAAHQSSTMNRHQGRLKTIFWLISFSEGPIQA